MFGKKVVFFGLICAVLISSCVSLTKPGIVFDESVPREQTSWISTPQVGVVTSYNGITVNWSRYVIVQIPAGDTLLEFNISGEISSKVILKADGVLFRYNFQPEKFYSFLVRETGNGQIGFRVYAWNFGETWGVFDDKHFVEFIPFLNLGSSAGPTVLK